MKVRDYANKDIDEMTAEELRHGALLWMNAEAEGEGRGDEKAAKKTEVKERVLGQEKQHGKKALLARIEQLEGQLKNR